MRRFLFVFCVGEKPVPVSITEDQCNYDYYAQQIKPILRGLELGEYWRQQIDDRWFVVIRIS